MKAIDAANYLIDLSLREGGLMTAITLQKKVYVAHGASLVTTNQPLVDEPFVARITGPLCLELWRATRVFLYHPVDTFLEGGDGECPIGDQKGILDAVYRKYKGASSYGMIQLSTKIDGPWSKVYNSAGGAGEVISDALIRQHFPVYAEA